MDHLDLFVNYLNCSHFKKDVSLQVIFEEIGFEVESAMKYQKTPESSTELQMIQFLLLHAVLRAPADTAAPLYCQMKRDI